MKSPSQNVGGISKGMRPMKDSPLKQTLYQISMDTARWRLIE